MARRPQGGPARPRAIAGTFAKPDHSPVPLTPLSLDKARTPSPQPFLATHLTQSIPPYDLVEDTMAIALQRTNSQPAYPHYPLNNLMPPPTSFSPHHAVNSMSSPYPSSSNPALSSSASSYDVSPMLDHQFGHYPQSYPLNPYFQPYSTADPNVFAPLPLDPAAQIQPLESDLDTPDINNWTDSDALMVPMSTSTASPAKASSSRSSQVATPQRTPRPPNAWILYRSHILHTLNKDGGDISTLPGLAGAMRDLGIVPGSGAESTSTETGDSSLDERRPKKSGKEAKGPAQGMLQKLGVGKNGRGIPQADVSRLISLLWKRESPAVKAKYEKMSEDRKKEHKEMYPEYKFQPLRKSDKERMKHEREVARQRVKDERMADKAKNGRSRKVRSSPTSAMTRQETRELSREINGERGFQSKTTSAQSSFPSTPDLLAYPEDDHKFRAYPFPMPGASLPAMREVDVGALAFDSRYAFHPGSVSGLEAGTSSDYGCPSAEEESSNMTGGVDVRPSESEQASEMYTPSIHISVPEPSGETHPSVSPQKQPTTIELSRGPIASTLSASSSCRVKATISNAGKKSSQNSKPKAYQSKKKPPPARRASQLAQSWLNSDSEDDEDPHASADATGDEGAGAITIPAGSYFPPNGDRPFRQEPSVPMDGSFANIELRSVINDEGDGWIAVPVPNPEAPSMLPQYPYQFDPQASISQQQGVYAYPQITQYPPDTGDLQFMDPDLLEQMAAMAEQNTYSAEGQPLYIYHTGQGPMVPMNLQVEETGPFLTEGPIFSPSEPTFNIPPPPPTFQPMWQGSEGRPSVGPYANAPRYVSTSAYPLTPQSMNQSLLPGGPGWNDRSTSFAYAGFQFPEGDGMSDDMLTWEENEDTDPMNPSQWNLDVPFEPIRGVRDERSASGAGRAPRMPTPISDTEGNQEKDE